MKIHGLVDDTIAYCEAVGFSKCFGGYAEIAGRGFEIQIGFNPQTGYTYIHLENGITIASMLGRDVEYIKTSMGTGEEKFFASYEAAEKYEFADHD